VRVVLLSGGSGKRLWPLSNDSRSKQFLKVLKKSENELESMIQRVKRQLENVNLINSTVVTTSLNQVDMVKSQLGLDIPVIAEPSRRDTFAAIALASSYLYSVEKVSKDEVITVLPVDPFVEDSFFNKVKELENLFSNTSTDLGLIGIKPTYPSSKYGYIVPSSEDNNVVSVESFKEKPKEQEAELLIQKNSLWNGGVFAFKLGYLLDILTNYNLPLNYNQLLSDFEKIPKNSFDYEVVERARNIKALSYKGSWKDLGTWNTLTEEMSTSVIGKARLSEDSVNTHIVNELDVPITAIGVKDIVVAASPDGILVTDKAKSPRLKEYIPTSEQPMYIERLSGEYRIIDSNSDSSNKTAKLSLYQGYKLEDFNEDNSVKNYVVLSGEVQFIEGQVNSFVRRGESYLISVRGHYSITAISDTELIEISLTTGNKEKPLLKIPSLT
jgi:mannose-1-phosphate guanylyltransferase